MAGTRPAFFEDNRTRIRSPLLLEAGVNHGFFTRFGGVSKPPYDKLNCGFSAQDGDQKRLEQNRAFVAGTLGLGADRLITLRQVHGTTVHVVDSSWTSGTRPEGDGFVTSIPGIGLGILTADCAPLLLADKEAGVIGAAHSGWRGTLGSILSEVVRVMVRQGARRENIHLAIGPAISQPNYEVDESYRDNFLSHSSDLSAFFVSGKKEKKYLFDLTGMIRAQALALGLESTDALDLCTYGDSERFFSCRRAYHNQEKDYGRLISVISL